MNYSESMSKRQQHRKALNQRFRRMFLVARMRGHGVDRRNAPKYQPQRKAYQKGNKEQPHEPRVKGIAVLLPVDQTF